VLSSVLLYKEYNSSNCLGLLYLEMVDVNHKFLGDGTCFGYECDVEMCNLFDIPDAYLLSAVPIGGGLVESPNTTILMYITLLSVIGLVGNIYNIFLYFRFKIFLSNSQAYND
jgi:hypothetical protein